MIRRTTATALALAALLLAGGAQARDYPSDAPARDYQSAPPRRRVGVMAATNGFRGRVLAAALAARGCGGWRLGG